MRTPPLRELRETDWAYARRPGAQRLDPAHLMRVERGEAGLSIATLARLSRVLGPSELVKMLAPYVDR